MVEDFLPHDYMKKDTYLIRWLRAKQLDLSSAKQMLKNNIEWRETNNIDDTVHDTTSPLAKEFPVQVPGVDKEGRPYFLQDWSGDMRKVMLSGRRKDFEKHVGSTFELVERKVRELNVHNNNTEFVGIYDFDKFSTATHLCVACLPTYLEHSGRYELYYSQQAKAFYVVNAPRIFQAVLRLIAPVIGNTVERITVYGTDKREWKANLLKIIPADQLPVKYGGTLQQ